MNSKKDNLLYERCLMGLHPLKEIYRSYGGFGDEVVRWCPECGAIVVDHDVDGRVYPGKHTGMKLSKLYIETRKLEDSD